MLVVINLINIFSISFNQVTYDLITSCHSFFGYFFKKLAMEDGGSKTEPPWFHRIKPSTKAMVRCFVGLDLVYLPQREMWNLTQEEEVEEEEEEEEELEKEEESPSSPLYHSRMLHRTKIARTTKIRNHLA